jgi:hypothetical protein
MRFVYGFLAVLILITANSFAAATLPVVVSEPLSANVDGLTALGFELHARSGNVMIGRVPLDFDATLPAGMQRLRNAPADFSGVYQVDRRAFAQAPGLQQNLSVLFEHEEWLLIDALPRHLNALSAAGIPFRAIPPTGYPLRKPLPARDDLDDMSPFVGVILDQVSSASFGNYLQTLEDFVTRNTYNPECDSAALWIHNRFQAMGLTTWLDSFQVGDQWRYNVTAELLGTVQPDEVFYVIAHHDATAGLPVLPEDEAPGADDDASGTAAVMEMARVLSTGFTFQKTIRFALFAGNEQGLLGSEAYVAGLPGTETCLGVLDADMIGWEGSDPWPPDLVIYTNDDPNSIALANKIAEAIALFVTDLLEPVVIQDPTMVYADHAPFWDGGMPAALAMEAEVWSPDLNPFYHSVDDLVEHLDEPFAMHVLKAVFASACDFAVPLGSGEPYLTADGAIIDDSQGNNNGQIEYGESILLTIPIINAGGAAAPSVDVTLSESDPYITFSDWQENYGTINSQDTVAIVNAFAADVAMNVPDAHLFDVTVTMVSGPLQWISVVQMAAHAPEVRLDDLLIDDFLGGNGNGQLEPGETADLEVTLYNEGSFQAQNLSATLTSTSPYIVINTPVQSYGTLPPYTGGMEEFNVAALASSPAYFQADFTLSFEAGGWTGETQFTLDVGDLTHLPTGPDTYGYSAYDPNDAPFGPAYNWIEIDPGQGGSGTELNFNDDDETLFVDLPFTFVYYGQLYTELSICSNGWIACGHRNNTDYSNTGIPDEDGPPAMIAPFWDDLSPQAEGSVSYYYDSGEGTFIVEYYDVRDFQPSWHNMTFQVILYDPLVHLTTTGDGKILFQYGNLDNTNSCTVGIENHDEEDGLQYLLNTTYDDFATPIGDGMAILFTTGENMPDVTVTLTPYGAPIQIPASGGSFSFNIAADNNESTSVSFDVWCDVTLPSGSPYGPVLGPVSLTFAGGFGSNRDRNQAVPAGAPTGSYSYNAYVGSYPGTVWNSDSFDFTKLSSGDGEIIEGWANWGEEFVSGETATAAIPAEFSLGQNYPNPFNPATMLSYTLPVASRVKLSVYDISGRLVADLANGWREAGSHAVTFDGSGLVSGVYLYRIEAGDYTAVAKMVLIK